MGIEDGIRLIKGNGLFEKIGLLGLIELEDEWNVLDGTNDGVFKFVAGGIDKINGIRDLGPEEGIIDGIEGFSNGIIVGFETGNLVIEGFSGTKVDIFTELGPEDGILEITAIDGTLEGVFDDITTQRS